MYTCKPTDKSFTMYTDTATFHDPVVSQRHDLTTNVDDADGSGQGHRLANVVNQEPVLQQVLLDPRDEHG